MAYSPPGRTRERVFSYVRTRLLQGRPPTVREVQEAMGFRSVQSAAGHLNALVDEGKLTKDTRRARGYQLGEAAVGRRQSPPRFVPLLGRVQAGALDEALQMPEGHLPVQTHHPPEELFALTVRGRSMVGAGILPGDLVVVRRQPTADSGDIVVALVGTETTVKRLRIRRAHVELVPENPKYSPIVPDPDELRILGKVIEVRRYLEQRAPRGAGA